MVAVHRRAPVVRLGLRENVAQFSLLVLVNAFVGAMVGMERSILPLLAEQEFQLAARTAILSFIVVFGVTKALTNYVAGRFADQIGRRQVLIAGWLVAVPVPFLLMWAPTWAWVLVANAFLGISQGLTWSTTVIMKIDLAGPRRRGLALGLNEAAGYGAVAVAAFVTGVLASRYGPRPVPFLLGIAIAVTGLVLSIVFVRETRGYAEEEARSHPRLAAPRPFRTTFLDTTLRDRSLSAICQAGLVNNLNDAMVWGLVPIFLAHEGLTISRIGIVTAIYPASWGLGQLATGAWSDRTGRKPLIVAGLWVQAAGIIGLAAAHGYLGWITAALAMGIGTALVYPTLIAAIGDRAHPAWRASAVGVYRLWRDLGYAAGGLLVGITADAIDERAAIIVVGILTAASGLIVALRMDDAIWRRLR
jgi:MFS family permease